jgi:hypothetical protein
MIERSISICGFPESGKTSYLAALWHLITTGSPRLCVDSYASSRILRSRHFAFDEVSGNHLSSTRFERSTCGLFESFDGRHTSGRRSLNSRRAKDTKANSRRTLWVSQR